MKARISPLEFHGSFATGLGFNANPQFDPSKPSNLSFTDLDIEVNAYAPGTPQNEDSTAWHVTLRVKQNVGPEKNAPYNFFLDLQGSFTVRAQFDAEKVPQLIETTGGSILFGSAREILRSVLATGPYLPLLLPAISFHPLALDPDIGAVAASDEVKTKARIRAKKTVGTKKKARVRRSPEL
ncbi:MAG: protein-export chaperone SecB [Verrucomicrobiota bacterium]